MARSRRLPKFFRTGEDEAMMTAAPTDRDRMIIRLGLFTGLRVSEIVHLRVEHVDLDGGTILVAEGKGKKDRYVPIARRLLPELERWIGDRTAGPVFVNRYGQALSTRAVQIMMKEAAAAAGITRKATPHVMRHTFATRALNSGANLREVQDLLGHASIATTEIYTHVAVDRLRGAVDRL